LNVVVDERMSLRSIGSRFHARGTLTENALSPNRRAAPSVGKKEVAVADSESAQRPA